MRWGRPARANRRKLRPQMASQLPWPAQPGTRGAGREVCIPWGGKRRLERLEKEIAEARAEQAALQLRLELFERIAQAAGTAPDDTVPLRPVPSSLLAAALDARPGGCPVRLAVGDDVVAVIGDDGGDPREWWTAIQRLATPTRSAS